MSGTTVRRGRTLLALLCCLLLAGACANIPEESTPEVVTGDQLGQISPDVPEPAKDADVLTVVREFVHASAKPAGDNAAARVYLDEESRKSWQPARGMSIIDNTFGTVYATGEEKPADPNERVVKVRGFQLGRLGSDSAFIPTKMPYELSVELRKQVDGQWRIVNPPPNLVITEEDFAKNYLRVPVYFFAQDPSALVPDLRYVPARPQSELPGRVVDLLLAGPSEGLSGAVRNPLGDDAVLDNNVNPTADGALLVPLSGLEDRSENEKQLIVAQVVRSLQNVTVSRIRILSDGAALVDGHVDWRPSELPSYEALVAPSADLPGLMTLEGRIRSLADGQPIPGPAGSGAYKVQSAAQSIGGTQIAIVEQTGNGVRLRVGEFGGEVPVVEQLGKTLTRPTWRPSSGPNAASGEVWTVVDGRQIVRVLRTPQGAWTPQPVDATDIAAIGPITDLRLSRDGVRVAAIAGGKLVVASVVRSSDSVTLRAPRVLQEDALGNVVDVDWATQDTLVAATSLQAAPVARLPVDGLRIDKFSGSNLTPPVTAVTAAPSRSVVVADSMGLWTAGEVGEVWRPHPQSPGADAVPFYPG
ncbi:Sporulation and spore germination [Amycolatopsis marina]|uniref:Sporulation and spore germination n=1 Tax=Amycolatopsis marina TaxID=490629 RepID=A0A1I1CJ00_9PSEU|nr:LpqB family beta-propeller domain-containing protein [Amycolatopsis marina]SFB61996.1 Sporulation and spore germination [Amycolatopsis marina]